MVKKNHSHGHGENHICGGGTIAEELMSHFPYAVFSVALSIVGVALLDYFSFGATSDVVSKGADILFHTFHFMHIIFAATGALLMYFRFSKNIVRGIIVGSISTVVFCVLSDVIFPYVAGMLLGVKMDLHICFMSELYNVLPFLLIGVINGWVLAQHERIKQSSYSLWSHFAHIFVSSAASLLYMVSHGFDHWEQHMGVLFLLLIAAVVVPCTMSDVIVPLFFAKRK